MNYLENDGEGRSWGLEIARLTFEGIFLPGCRKLLLALSPGALSVRLNERNVLDMNFVMKRIV